MNLERFRRRLFSRPLPDYFPAEWLDEFSRPLYVGLLCTPRYEEPWYDPAYKRAALETLSGDRNALMNASAVCFPTATCDWGKLLSFGLYTSQAGTGVITTGPMTYAPFVARGDAVTFHTEAVRCEDIAALAILDYLNGVA